ncbi:hypothetical protein N7492_002419 [Penicillium capsulatum]|uniref:HNH nuclease domain-containing protein n=1 Tax=Penicillium capsulatum TaxID=69766 RepID=A0A9W9IK09_9EURO|nr:hypothetical protein N7492_002419 [Penicillium capsulatum]KAJ6122976.1 hypothetical protein N7512_005441 [Penicillium capsulatum]
MTRVLQPPPSPSDTVLIYHNNGPLLASFSAEPCQRGDQWVLFPLSGTDEDLGNAIPQTSRARVTPGNSFVLSSRDRAEFSVELTRENAPRRVQARFRERLSQRDEMCAISNGRPVVVTSKKPHKGLVAAHVFPVSQLSQWYHDYRSLVNDTGPPAEIGKSRIYSSQNGLLLTKDMHSAFDDFIIGVNPDAGYKIVPFETDTVGIGGTRLRDSARYGTAVPAGDSANNVSPDLLRWHLRMCVLSNIIANAEPQEYWEEDLGEDNMGQILEQPDAAEIMELELFTRLGELIA